MALKPGDGVDLDGDGIIEALEGLVSQSGPDATDLDGDGVIEAIEGIVDGIKTGVFVSDATVPQGEVDELAPDPDPLGDTDVGPLGVMSGGRLIRVDIPGQPNRDDIFLQAFDLPDGTTVYFQYNSADQVGTAFGEPFAVDLIITEVQFDSAVADQSFILGGEAGEVLGDGEGTDPGNFNDFYRTAQTQALAAAGVTDPSIVGQLLADPEVQAVLTLGQIAEEGLTDEQVLAHMRNTTIWTEVLYPGIEFFYQRGDANPETSHVNYQRSVADGLRQLGVEADADGSYKSTVGNMLDSGIDDGEFSNFLPTALKVQENPGLKDTMDAWALQELGRPLDFDEFLDVLENTNDPELDAVIEGATLQFMADAAGFDISVDDIKRIAEGTDLTDASASLRAQILRTPRPCRPSPTLRGPSSPLAIRTSLSSEASQQATSSTWLLV